MSNKRKVLQGSASNIARLILSALAAMVLPPFLVHHLSQAEYSAWVLILQLCAYVNLLDLGLQMAVGKFVAEYHASGDRDGSRRLVSTSITLLMGMALVAMGLVAAMAWRVPELFHQMPRTLLPEVRRSLVVIGFSSAIALPFTPFASVFTGLQEYGFPTVLAAVCRILTVAVLITILLLHSDLFQLALVIAFFNIAMAIAQFQGWKRYARERVGFSFPFFDRKTAVQLTKYGGVLAIWTLGGLFISGLDIIIVGHFDYKNTGFYAIGASATNFMLLIVSSLFLPLVPAISSMQQGSTPKQIGDLAIRATRYCTLSLCLLGLPLLVGAYPVLSLWVGHEYAIRSVVFLSLLVLGNMIRQLAYPYSLVVVATGKQHLATAAAVAEAIVNVVLSVWLAQKIGAIGVALGTIAGAFIGVGLHLAVSMRFTKPIIFFPRSRFIFEGLLRPLACITPSLLLYPFWKRTQMIPANLAVLATWLAVTAAFAWMAGLTAAERRRVSASVYRASRVSRAWISNRRGAVS